MKNAAILFLYLLLPLSLYGNLQYTISNYAKKEYGAGNQNWQVDQHSNGWMYFANNKGLLEFDGVYWNLYPLGNTKMRSLAIGKNNRIYAGGMEEFGYFTPDEKGKLVYNTLSDSLRIQTKIGVIWKIYDTPQGTYFISNNAVFLFDNDEISIVVNNQNISCSLFTDNNLYLHTNQGLMVLEESGLRLLSNTTQLHSMKLVGMVMTPQGILIITSRDGLFVYRNQNLLPYSGIGNEFFQENQIFCATVNNSLLALGTVQSGVLILDLETEKIKKVSVENGLQNKTVLGLFFDRDNNLWIGLDNGIDCIHLNSPVLSLFDSKEIGTGYSARFKNNYLYLGTNQGLYYTDANSFNDNFGPDVQLMKGTEGQVWSLRYINGEIFCNSDNGVFALDGLQAVKIPGTWGTWNLVPANLSKNILIGGTYSGLFVLKKENEQWKYLNHIEGFQQSCKMMMAEDLHRTLWIANSEHGIHRLILSDDLLRVDSVKKYNNGQIPVSGNTYISRVDDEIVFATVSGLYRYNHSGDLIEKHQELEQMLDGNTIYSYIVQDDYHNIWYVANGMLKMIRYNSEKRGYEPVKYGSYLSGSLIEDFEDIFFYSRDKIFIGTEDGFSFIDLSQNPVISPINLQIRKVFNTNGQDSLVNEQSFIENNRKTVLPYSLNSIRIEYAACCYDPSQTVLFSCRLTGASSEDWSEFSKHTSKEYTHLREGKYTFEVRARTDNSSEPVTATFSFRISPPWYRTRYAYVLYTFLFFCLVYLIWRVIHKSRRLLILQQQQEMLKQELEFKKENELKDQKIDLLRGENLKAELRHKTAELVNSTLNLTRKNEILQEIRKEVVIMRNAISEGDMVNIRRRNFKLLSAIDSNLEQDKAMESFQENFDILHHDFFQALEINYPSLTKKEKILCAYVRMNMLTKEIAPLLNMSVRGLEITRYRLRKKLGLEKQDNLYEFLQKIGRTDKEMRIEKNDTLTN